MKPGTRNRLFAFIAAASALVFTAGVQAETKAGDVFPALTAVGLVPVGVFSLWWAWVRWGPGRRMRVQERPAHRVTGINGKGDNYNA